ncbi:hypothetical protein EHS25_002203 [Saitozyma podzolica]|uniref:galacturonan 1,4-alpha-galacturonidase n=1 Tax=Saitozyma podzolica TaxID=1890683 RepID=A0A427YEY1_9TREE|nr:hypothetical protein EHS25_002203 [Saitozyma podzolica]
MLPLIPAALLCGALVGAHQTCVVPHGGKGVNDAIGLKSLLSNCSTDATIVFQEKTTYNISTPVVMSNLSNVEIQILGNLDLPKSIPYVQAAVNASGGRLYWFTVSGNNVTLSGNQDEDWGWVDSYGVPWWQAAAYTQPLGGLANRPHGWSISANNSVVRWLKLRKPIAWNLAITGNNNHIYGNKIDAAYDLDTPSVFPFNTDGYDISGNNVLVEDSWVFNGDDCIAVNKGNNITFRDSVCIGGHGASVSATTGVSNVLINNVTSKNSLYATRFKSSLNSVGNITNASDVTWSNIHVHNATFPIFATGVYFDQNTNRGLTPGNYPANSTATHISNFEWINVTGTINDVYPGDGSCVTNPCWYYVANVTKNAGVTMQLLNGTATNIRVLNAHLKPIDGQGESDVLCDPRSFTDGTANLGFKCANGPFVPT